MARTNFVSLGFMTSKGTNMQSLNFNIIFEIFYLLIIKYVNNINTNK